MNEVRQYSWVVHDNFTSSIADESGRGREGERNERGVKRGEVRKVPSFYIEQVLPRKGWKEEENRIAIPLYCQPEMERKDETRG